MDTKISAIIEEARAKCFSGQIEEAFTLVHGYASLNPECFEALYFLARLPNQYCKFPSNYYQCALFSLNDNTSPIERLLLLCDISQSLAFFAPEISAHYLNIIYDSGYIPKHFLDEIDQHAILDTKFRCDACRFFLSWKSISPFDDPYIYYQSMQSSQQSITGYLLGFFLEKYNAGEHVNNIPTIEQRKYFSEHAPDFLATMLQHLEHDFRYCYVTAMTSSLSESMREYCRPFAEDFRRSLEEARSVALAQKPGPEL